MISVFNGDEASALSQPETLAAPFNCVSDEAADPKQEAHYVSNRDKPEQAFRHWVLDVLDSDGPGHCHPDRQGHREYPPANGHASFSQQKQKTCRRAMREYQPDVSPRTGGASTAAPSRLVQKQFGQTRRIEDVIDDIFG